MQKDRLAPLTSLRFFAAALVVAEHYFDYKMGHAGVSFFFLLSGFILAYNYGGTLVEASSRRRFYLRRFARIYPTHVLTLVLALPLAMNDSHRHALALPAHISAQLLLAQSFVPMRSFYLSLNDVAWSISDETFFYAVFPFVALRLVGGRRERNIIAGLLLMLAAIAAIVWRVEWRDSSLADDATYWLFYINPVTRLVEFVVGVALGLNFLDRKQGSHGWRHEAGALMLAFATLLAAGRLPPRDGVFVGGLCFVPAAATIVHVFARSTGPLARMLRWRVLVVLGEASFMLYMIHELLLRYADHALALTLPIKGVLALAAVLASIAGHYWFERPARDAITGFRARKEVAATPP